MFEFSYDLQSCTYRLIIYYLIYHIRLNNDRCFLFTYMKIQNIKMAYMPAWKIKQFHNL